MIQYEIHDNHEAIVIYFRPASRFSDANSRSATKVVYISYCCESVMSHRWWIFGRIIEGRLIEEVLYYSLGQSYCAIWQLLISEQWAIVTNNPTGLYFQTHGNYPFLGTRTNPTRIIPTRTIPTRTIPTRIIPTRIITFCHTFAVRNIQESRHKTTSRHKKATSVFDKNNELFEKLFVKKFPNFIIFSNDICPFHQPMRDCEEIEPKLSGCY